MTDQSKPGAIGSNDQLGLLPDRAGQPDVLTMAGCHGDDEAGHWYSPAAVRQMQAAERVRVKNLAQLAVSYAKDADWSRVKAVLGLIDGPNALSGDSFAP